GRIDQIVVVPIPRDDPKAQFEVAGPEDPLERLDRRDLPAALDARDRRLRRACACGELALGEAGSAARLLDDRPRDHAPTIPDPVSSDPEVTGRPRLADAHLVRERPDELPRSRPEVRRQREVHHEDDALAGSDRPGGPAVKLVEAAFLRSDPLVEERAPWKAEGPAGVVPQADSVNERRASP